MRPRPAWSVPRHLTRDGSTRQQVPKLASAALPVLGLTVPREVMSYKAGTMPRCWKSPPQPSQLARPETFPP
jgi:hypothetical protein